MNRLDRGAVSRGFDLGDGAIDRQTVLAHRRRQVTGSDDGLDLGQATVIVAASIRLQDAAVPCRHRRVGRRRRFCRRVAPEDTEPGARETGAQDALGLQSHAGQRQRTHGLPARRPRPGAPTEKPKKPLAENTQ